MASPHSRFPYDGPNSEITITNTKLFTIKWLVAVTQTICLMHMRSSHCSLVYPSLGGREREEADTSLAAATPSTPPL